MREWALRDGCYAWLVSWLRAALLALFCVACGNTSEVERPLESVSEAQETAPESTSEGRDRRMPTGFPWPLPEDAVVRYGHAREGIAEVLCTSELAVDAIVQRYEAVLAANGGEVSVQRNPRGAILRRTHDDVAPVEVQIRRGASGLVRVRLRAPSDVVFSPLPEDPEWARLRRPPLPAPPGAAISECTGQLNDRCAVLESLGGGSRTLCMLDARAACWPSQNAQYIERSVADAEIRLREGLVAYDRMGSRGARARALAQAEVLVFAAHVVQLRAAHAGIAHTNLQRLLNEAVVDGLHLADAAQGRAWFVAYETPTSTPLDP